MNSADLRIFVTTSHISTVYMTLYAQSTRKPGDVDVLLVDGGVRRQFLLDLIRETSTFHSWNLFHSFSETVDSSHDFKPSGRKTLTRKWKGLPGIRMVYNVLLRRYTKKKQQQYRATLDRLFAGLPAANSVQLFLMVNTHIGETLQQMFPGAPVGFMEHGIGDYFYVQEKRGTNRKFFAVFAHPFKAYLEKQHKPSDYVSVIPGLENFGALAHPLLEKHRPLLDLEQLNIPQKPVVFILLEAVDMYNVPERFWKEYLEKIISKLDNAGQYHYLLKTHPIQSNVSIRHSEDFFREKGFTCTLLSGEKLSSVSAEVLFDSWAKQTHHVFCLFSSGCFYLSQLYRDPQITYWYSTEFMSRYIGNAPPQYKVHFEGLRPIVEQVFAERCRTY